VGGRAAGIPSLLTVCLPAAEALSGKFDFLRGDYHAGDVRKLALGNVQDQWHEDRLPA